MGSFCKECIHRIKAANQACPTCNDKDFTLFPNKGLQQSLYDFRVYCPHKSKGCGWTGELREVDNHLNSDPPADESLQGCPFTLIKCPLGCVSCVEGMSRKNYKSHINDKLLSFVMGQAAVVKSVEQENIQLKARLVDIEGDKQYLEQRVMDLEKEMKGQLSSSEGDKLYLEQQVAELVTTASQLIKKFQELEVKNRELENAMKMKLPAVVSNPQPGQFSSNQQRVTYVTGPYKPSGAQFTMTDFEEYKKDNDMWWSSHFYTHPNGYRMCLRVHANGLGSSKGIHLSVFLCLMRGEFDDQLKWPFKGSVTIKLMNQEEDKDHIVQTAKYQKSLSEEYFTRVMEEERSSKVWGIFNFLPLTKLKPKYLKNDCIKLCIKKVEIF